VRVLLVSGIWPPDVGGPASHGPDFGDFLQRRGHSVRAVTTAVGGGPEPASFPLRSASRERPLPVRLAIAGAALSSEARGADVIYATGMYTRSSQVSRLLRIPLVLKLVKDPAYERARSLGLFEGTLEDFQSPTPPGRVRALKALRRLAISRASRIVIPSQYLAEIVRGWGVRDALITVIPNPAPPTDGLPPRDEARRRLRVNRPTLVFAGRIVPQKNLPLAIAALREAPEASLVIVGDGPERPAVESAVSEAGVGDRVRLVGAVPRASVSEWMRAADAVVLPSDWENFPHAAVEALSAGTPVVATSVGGVPEIVQHGVNGLLVPAGDAAALAEAMRTVTENAGSLSELRAGAAASGGRYVAEETFAQIELELARAVAAR
jgi:glycosyltransferase involved in cell wall biosynthesis